MWHELCYIICPVILYALFLRPAQVTSWPMGVSPAGSVGYRLRGVAGTEACASDTIIAPSWRCRCCCRQRRRRRRRRHRHCCGFGMNYKTTKLRRKRKRATTTKTSTTKQEFSIQSRHSFHCRRLQTHIHTQTYVHEYTNTHT